MIRGAALTEPRAYKIQMRAMIEGRGESPETRQATLDAAVTNRAAVDAAARELANAARDAVRCAVYKTMAITALKEKLAKYDMATKGVDH